ncbi:hypothetical protein [uncultured Shewanella sp.]|uniref:hypothetical protein n=1 Tax=uncultured Shewanella sp. TaxID=173975 RepID=UPI00260E8184|nr:hypothetical protein [uncultured Shewanella sp.]
MKLVIVTTVCFLLLACKDKENPTVTFQPDPDVCHFQTSGCQKSLDDIAVALTLILSRPDAPSETPFEFSLSTNQVVENVTMRLEGRDMFMGVIPIRLTQISDKDYSGHLLYGSCSSGYMVWNAIVTFNYLGRHHEVLFAILADNVK